MVTITGRDTLKKALGPINGERAGKINAALIVAGGKIAGEAKELITTNAVSGKGHVPSKPGDPPSNDTGVLKDGIITRSVAPFRVEIASTAPYGVALEFGTTRMAERPFMRPAVAMKRDEAVSYLTDAVAKIMRKP